VRGTFLNAVLLLLCTFSIALVACSEKPPNKPDRGEAVTAPQRTAPQRTVASGGYVEHTVGSMTLRHHESVLAIEEAELLADEEDRDEIVVQATIRRQHEENRGCFLMEERAWLALKRSFESGNTPDPALQMESSWADPLRSEEFSGGDTYVVVFQEGPDEEAADPRQTPFFALCFKEPVGSGRLTAWYDVGHVEGTPEAS
jgi:hypothetical protein